MCFKKRSKKGSVVINALKTKTARRSCEIDSVLEDEKQRIDSQKTVLILGSAESGKSTVLKQMRIRFGSQYDRVELETFRLLVHQNIFAILTQIIMAMKRTSLEAQDKTVQVICEKPYSIK